MLMKLCILKVYISSTYFGVDVGVVGDLSGGSNAIDKLHELHGKQ
jgi:hypothetical protein